MYHSGGDYYSEGGCAYVEVGRKWELSTFCSILL